MKDDRRQDEAMDELPGNFQPIRKAAVEVHKSRAFVRKLIDDGELTAIRNGGDPNSPRLKVDVNELRAAIVRTQMYVPRGDKHKPKARTARKMHPAAMAM